jgi:hypothetical protein
MERNSVWTERKTRYPVEIEATVLRPDGGKTPVRLTNFSDNGCRIEGTDGFRIGERFQIAIPRMGQVKAQVRWALPDSVGVRFVAESDFQA